MTGLWCDRISETADLSAEGCIIQCVWKPRQVWKHVVCSMLVVLLHTCRWLFWLRVP